MGKLVEEYQIQTESLIQTVKEGPKLTDIAERVKQGRIRGIEERGNIISFDKVVYQGAREAGRCTEGQAVIETVQYIERVIDEARKIGDYDTARRATLLLENLVFIGEKELQEAISAIASRLLERAKEGKTVVIFFGGLRSERYIALRVLEQIDKMITEISEDEDRERLHQNIRISGNSEKVAKLAERKNWNCLVAVCDDFILSGTRIKGFLWSVLNRLIERGVTLDQALEIVEVEVIATHGSFIQKGLKTEEGTPTERNFKVFSYYVAPEYCYDETHWVFYPGASVTGSHCSVDYGFEAIIDMWRKEFPGLKLPPLYRIIRRYQSDMDGRFTDPKLQQKWETLSAAYLLR
uniref:Uncharacterized protein n=1 Tax=candidate division CPR3 bacterium TaxID=2268181 RepID=A0A7C5YUM1_UNCC3